MGEQQNADVATTLGLNRSAGRTVRRWRWLLAALVAVLIAGPMLFLLPGEDGAVRYKTAEVRRGDLTVVVNATGTLEPTNQVDVGSELSGIIDSVELDYNDRVSVGQVLARLDTDKLRAQVLQSQEALEAAQAKVLEAQATVFETRLRSQRCERLAAKKMCSQEDVDTSLAGYKRARAEEGIVLVRNVEPGKTVAATLQAPVLFTLEYRNFKRPVFRKLP